ncbi:MAG: thioredoxin-dependent thiol peroxidase [Candidatus Liptonbacteria bacterium]|nr:thioredoxin-dependent thiol peroxidase [Candidatus Liptonbacteria bacterium]
MKPKVGNLAPDFTLPDQSGENQTLSGYRGKWVLVYFYPKDNTPGCTAEACSLRDAFDELKKRNVVVLGISTDSVKSHAGFAEKHKLPFTLLSDTEKTLVNLYGVWGKKKFMGREYMGTLRNSYLVDPNGKLAKIYEGVKPEGHAEEVLKDLGQFQA